MTTHEERKQVIVLLNQAVTAGARRAKAGVPQSLSRDGVAYLLVKYVAMACQHCPSLQHKRVTPHVLRHSAAMGLLQSGVDCAVIALWLGHESTDTTQIYLHASLELKERALEKTTPINGHLDRFRPDDELMAFLKGL